MNALTIEQLKALEVGDWVWDDIRKTYYSVHSTMSKEGLSVFTFCKYEDTVFLPYTAYGKTWLAYKNKEQAEGKDEDMAERIEKAYEHNIAECERCMKKVDIKHQFAMESMKEYIRKETAKEILTMLKDWCNRNTPIAVDIQELAEKYGVEVDE